jgi:3-deoxy-D-manno-octulosonic acid kinase
VTPAIARGPGWAVLHDPALAPGADDALFDAASWLSRIRGYAGRGRGRVVFVEAGGQEWALRRYHRGGMIGRLVEDGYLWTGEERTRSFREWRMLARLHEAGLPVPRPVAAGWTRRGAFYTANLATVRIPDAAPLSARLAAGEPVDWRRIGETLQAFHAAGAYHADLNAHNILLDLRGDAWLLDFDRGSIRTPGAWQARNLARLERSLRKLTEERGAGKFIEPGWKALEDGYRAARDLSLGRASAP